MKNKIKLLGILCSLVFGFLAFTTLDKKVVVIDAGHGGEDVGAKVSEFEEKLITEAVAKRIKEQNKNANVEIVLLREGDVNMALKERVLAINNLKPDLVISLHISANSNSNANGVEAYISSKKTFYDQSKEIAETVISNIATTGNLTKRTVSEAPFFILKNSDCPTMLLEMGFLSNEKDRNYITTEKGQDEIAAKILESVK
ncbi:N-acetylmuramoyl-L-alanine amidase [Flavobacterium sp. LHD-80]|uniref:N-acetylmuramoyl-L-alanine amidase family protein n=1 Tax=Flavobacterium sp. LHD-80 TaxID=3071411 RepID=UPI0027E10D12|nr:N-acetylmuramoyl-L-alanine amidase [Flavobacterium sp. LHD-80]MDQ6470001.1 N-acetylmuramoyl-L-alanine amidase [Flavobacterium sp. LHD-80]